MLKISNPDGDSFDQTPICVFGAGPTATVIRYDDIPGTSPNPPGTRSRSRAAMPLKPLRPESSESGSVAVAAAVFCACLIVIGFLVGVAVGVFAVLH